MIENIPIFIYFIILLILVIPTFFITNNNFKILFKNLIIWSILFIIIIFIYKQFIIN